MARRSIGILLAAAASALGAAAAVRTDARPPAAAALPALAAALRVPPWEPAVRAHPSLMGRLHETPHNYFRFVNRRFTRAACGLFDDVRPSLPEVNLHGDAHVEQYAVTGAGRGLIDFDDVARGPYVVDLVRFGVSLELAGRENGWGGARGAVDDFLRGYRDALSEPSRERPPRRTIRRARAGFAFDHGLALRRADALMASDPVRPSELEASFEGYASAMRRRTPGLPGRFFRIKKAARLRSGIGSALVEKYLLRVEGWTTASVDDQILEAKLVRMLPDTGCVHTDAGPGRMPLGMALFGASFPFPGSFDRGDRSFWVHGWTDDYVELSIRSSFPELRDLREVAYDVGTQLGRAHPRERPGSAGPSGSRASLLESARSNDDGIRAAIELLTEAVVHSWNAFRDEPS